MWPDQGVDRREIGNSGNSNPAEAERGEKMSADDHKGADATIVSVVEGGRWNEVARLK